MTQDEIYEMVRQSDLGFLLGDNWMLHHELEHFANLVAQEVRDRIIFGSRDDWVIAEREACAKVCEELEAKDESFYCEFSRASDCATAIRARGEQA